MSHEKSEEMMRLLQELTILKEMDGDASSDDTDAALSQEQVLRERRKKQIAEEMHQLASEAKTEASRLSQS